MSLRSKLVLILAGVITLYGGIHLMVERMVVFPSFEQLEKREAQEDLHRVVEAIHSEVQHLDTTCHDWSAWDDTYDFVATGNPKYVEANLQNTSLESARVDMMRFVRVDGSLVRLALRTPANGVSPPELREFAVDRRNTDDPMRCVASPDASLTGILLTTSGPMLVSSRPIVKSNREGPIHGYLVMGRLLGDEIIRGLVGQTSVQFRLWPLNRLEKLPPEAHAGWQAVSHGQTEAILASDDHTLPAFASVAGMSGEPILLVQADIPRDLMNEGRRAIAFAMGSAVGAGVLVLCVLAWLLQRTVVEPLADLTAHAVAIRRLDDLGTRLDSTRKDEIGALSRQIDAMCDKLSQSRSELIESARRAGRSEVAVDVLHNIGNVLNGIHVSVGEIHRGLKKMDIEDLARISKTIESHSKDLAAFLVNENEGRELVASLCILSKRFEEKRAALLRETDCLSESLDHVHELVRAQQDDAGNAEAPAGVSLSGEIETALRLSGADAEGHIQVVREIDELPRVRIQKHRLLQILVNLLKNARESMEEAGVHGPRLGIRMASCAEGSRVRIEVSDNGVGIAPERLVSVFAHGQTTKKNGHGFGLHASASAAREMGGSLSAKSAGPGRGATFTLELPVEREALAA
jgi:sensor domain CHASE-containing protein